jgi:hypothetical protein
VNLLYPKLRLQSLPWLLKSALAGAAIAGCYGVLHDQITYSLAPEYFTKLKFIQFRWADPGLPSRIFVAEIGFLASWWVGLFAGWFIGRLTVRLYDTRDRVCGNLRAFTIIFCFALAGSFGGYLFGLLHQPNYADWSYFAERGVLDLAAFVRVAYIHNGSYLGGLLGLIAALFYLRKMTCRPHAFAHDLPHSIEGISTQPKADSYGTHL